MLSQNFTYRWMVVDIGDPGSPSLVLQDRSDNGGDGWTIEDADGTLGVGPASSSFSLNGTAGLQYLGYGDDFGFAGIFYTDPSPTAIPPNTTYFLTNENYGDESSLPDLVADDYVYCFLPGTRIATPLGQVAVEALGVGDLVLTADGRAVPVKWLGRQTLAALFMPETRRPVAIAPGALGDGLPARELRVTADHALLLDGVLVNAGALVNGTTIRRLTAAELGATFTVFHIETAGHEVVLAEGCPAETFVDNVTRARFDNFAEYLALYGEEASMDERPEPRVASARQVPALIRARIAAIAAESAPRAA